MTLFGPSRTHERKKTQKESDSTPLARELGHVATLCCPQNRAASPLILRDFQANIE